MEYSKKKFSLPIRNDLWENINWEDDEYCQCKPPYDIEKWDLPDCFCKKCGRIIPDSKLP